VSKVFAAHAAGNSVLATQLDNATADPAQRTLESEIYSDANQQKSTTDAAIASLRSSEFLLLVATPIAFAIGLVLLALFLRISRSYQRTIEVRANRDALTGLPNRECFYDRGVQALLGEPRHGSVTSVLVIDLDRFKELNDTLGHRYGDQLLCQIGPRLAPVLRASDTLARLGGDEFAILLPDSGSPGAAHEVAERLVAALREPFTLDALRFTIDASCGHATSPDDGTDIDALLQHADVAMYIAKSAHTDAVAYHPTLDVNTPTRLAILSELPAAIRDGELVLHYQPKIHIATRRVVGVEALVRWEHPTRGVIPPDDFVPAAEHSGLIKPLTSWVLDTALAQRRRWIDTTGHSSDLADLTVAVNLSTRNLLDENFPNEVQRALERHRVPAALLTLEVTETAIMADPVRAHAILRELHDLGVTLSIDDFGTGYSSLAYLKFLAVDELKIDKSFVRHMNDNPNDLTIVRAVIDLAHNLGLKTVAEGIEDQGTLKRLSDLGCDVAQGYHLARPMTANALDTWFLTSSDSIRRDSAVARK
jgi:diguanylate cyclase (GGDEF)-like protein